MDQNTMIIAVATFAISIVGWFLKGLINELKNKVSALEIRVATNSTNIEVLKSDHSNLGKKIDEICVEIKEISLYIRNLNRK